MYDDNNNEKRPEGGVFSGSQLYDYSSNNENQVTYTTDPVEPKIEEPKTEYTKPEEPKVEYTRPEPPRMEPPKPEKPKKEKKEKKSNPFWGKFFGVIGLGIVFGLTAGVTLYFMSTLDKKVNTPASVPEIVEEVKEEVKQEPVSEVKDVAPSTEAIPMVSVLDVSDVVEDVMPSVVTIDSNIVTQSQNFFGQIFERETTGGGSGIIIDRDDKTLYIATNNHVVEDAKELKVKFIDGSEASARVKGTDAKIDLAVILVDLDDIDDSTENAIKLAKLGDSDSIRVGEPAIAIGNSLGYGQTVTAGVVSAVDRTIDIQDGTTASGLIQTDAAINPGNSGGALVNIRGEVIGINSSKIGGSAVDGVGFAIPISSASPILSDIALSADRVKVADSKVGYLGIGGVTVTGEVSQMYGIPVGVAVRQVYIGTGADEAGIQAGDVITAVNDKDISSMDELREELEYCETGSVVPVKLYRIVDGEYNDMTLQVRLVAKETLDDASVK